VTTRSDAVKALDPKVVLAVARFIAGDGWTIFKPAAFTELGVPAETLAHFIKEYQSDTSDPKQTIFGSESEVLDEVRGVYGLDFVMSLVRELVPGFRGTKMGRGFSAREATEALTKHFTDKESANGDTSTESENRTDNSAARRGNSDGVGQRRRLRDHRWLLGRARWQVRARSPLVAPLHGAHLMSISKEKALNIARMLNSYSEDGISFIHKITGDFALVKEWSTAEGRLADSEEVLESLSNISWEKHQDKIDDLISLAETERDELLDVVDRFHKKFDIDRS
jgi:hypothetical protein